MKKLVQVLCLSFFFCNLIPAQEKTAPAAKPSNSEAASEAHESANPEAARLPVRRVVLYKNGVGYFEHLGDVRGARLEVRSGSGGAIAGKLLSVEKRSREKDGATTEWTEISLVSDRGEVRSLEMTPTTSVRII